MKERVEDRPRDAETAARMRNNQNVMRMSKPGAIGRPACGDPRFGPDLTAFAQCRSNMNERVLRTTVLNPAVTAGVLVISQASAVAEVFSSVFPATAIQLAVVVRASLSGVGQAIPKRFSARFSFVLCGAKSGSQSPFPFPRYCTAPHRYSDPRLPPVQCCPSRS